MGGITTGPALVHVCATAGSARVTTLADDWDAWLAAPAHHLTDLPAAGAPAVVCLLACGADLCRWIRVHRASDPLVHGRDAIRIRTDDTLARIRNE